MSTLHTLVDDPITLTVAILVAAYCSLTLIVERLHAHQDHTAILDPTLTPPTQSPATDPTPGRYHDAHRVAAAPVDYAEDGVPHAIH